MQKEIPLIRFVTVLLATLLASPAALAQDDWRKQFLHIDAPVVLLKNVRIVDGSGGPPAVQQSILISNGRIEAVGPALRAPEGARVVDLAGRTVLPGLVMLHDHLMYFSGRAIWHAQPISYPKLYLAAGVTTVRTAGSEQPEVDRNLKARIDGGHAPGPRIHLTGPFFNGAASDFLGDTVIHDEAEARAAVAYWAGRGFRTFKLYDAVDASMARVIIDEAHARGIKVTGHLGAMGCIDAARLGIDFIEHAFASCHRDLETTHDGRGFHADMNDPKLQPLMDALLAADVVLVSTPTRLDAPLTAEELELLAPQARERYLADSANPPSWLPDVAGTRELRKLERAYVARGGRLGVGADAMDFGQIAGYANHRALLALVEDGWTPAEVIRMVTSNNADLLGVGDHVGRIAPGYLADLIVVTGDPLADIREASHIELVFKDGQGYDPAKLREAAKGLVGWH
jgi:imidazolonepropionase-like amidohydrolase